MSRFCAAMLWAAPFVTCDLASICFLPAWLCLRHAVDLCETL